MRDFDPGLKSRIREAFEKPVTLWVKITPTGFLLEGEDSPIRDLEGRVIRVQLVRKLFRRGALLCHSADGIRARNGTLCAHCLHPLCKPQLRIHLASPTLRCLLDLSGRSADNFLALEAQFEAEKLDLVDQVLRLTVADRGKWGEVRFDRVGGGP